MGSYYDNFTEKREEEIKTSADYKALMESSWSYGQRMIAKYYLSDLGGIMNMDSDTYQDLKDMYALATGLKDLSSRMCDQMDQQTRVLFHLERQNQELLEKVGVLQEEIDSLKLSKALKKLD